MLSGITLALEMAVLTVLQSAGYLERPLALMLPLIFLFVIAYYADLRQREDMEPVSLALLLGLLFRIALLLFDIYGRAIYVLPNSAADADGFFSAAVMISQGVDSWYGGPFANMFGILFRYIGVSRVYAQFIVALFSMVALQAGDKCLRLCEVDDETRTRTMMILCLLPNFAILSSIFLRESVVTMLISLSLYAFVKWYKEGSEGYFLMALVLSILSMRFHSGSIGVPAAYLASRLVYDKCNHRLALSLGNVMTTVILLVLGVFFFNRYGTEFMGKLQRIDEISDIARDSSGSGGSTYAQYVGNSRNLASMAIYTLPRVFFFLFSPIPILQWRGPADIIAFLFSSMYYLVAIIQIFRGLRNNEGDNHVLLGLLVMVAAAVLFVFAWGTDNAGTATRHRDKMVVVYGVMMGVAMNRNVSLIRNTTKPEFNPHKSRYIK